MLTSFEGLNNYLKLIHLYSYATHTHTHTHMAQSY
jgi:hypothetical protein